MLKCPEVHLYIHRDITNDLAVVFVHLHNVAFLTVTLVGTRSVRTDLTAHAWTLPFTLIYVNTGEAVLRESVSRSTSTTLHSK